MDALGGARGVRRLLQKRIAEVLLEVVTLLVASLVPSASALLLLPVALFDCFNLLLLGVSDTNHTLTAVGTRHELLLLVTTTNLLLLALLAVHGDVAIFVFTLASSGNGTWYRAALGFLHALSNARVVPQVLAVVLVK